jgi:hypothetical protein
VLYQHPLTAPLWLGGLWFLGRDPRTRFVAAAYGIFLVSWLVSHAKPYYLAPAYPPLLAAGAVHLERAIRIGRRSRLRVAVPVALAAGGAVLVPLAMPVLPLATADRYIDRLVGFAIASPVDLTLELHDEYGWREQVEPLVRVLATLPPAERAGCAILAWNYGQAAAVNVFGPAYGLPPAVSGNMSYFLWGPGRVRDATTVIAFGMPRRELLPRFTAITPAARIGHPLAVPWERDLPVYVRRVRHLNLRPTARVLRSELPITASIRDAYVLAAGGDPARGAARAPGRRRNATDTSCRPSTSIQVTVGVARRPTQPAIVSAGISRRPDGS